MPRNLGATRLKRPPRRHKAMQEFDRLPPDLRRWLSDAHLPWSARSAARAYQKALERSGDAGRALRELDALQERLVAKDAPSVWGATHPAATGDAGHI